MTEQRKGFPPLGAARLDVKKARVWPISRITGLVNGGCTDLRLVVAIFISYAIVEPGSWFNPATALFVVLAYATLIISAVAHLRSSEKLR